MQDREPTGSEPSARLEERLGRIDRRLLYLGLFLATLTPLGAARRRARPPAARARSRVATEAPARPAALARARARPPAPRAAPPAPARPPAGRGRAARASGQGSRPSAVVECTGEECGLGTFI